MYRYRARVNFKEPDSKLGPFAYDVLLSTRPNVVANSPRNTPPGTIDGAVNPEAIPLEIVYSFFVREASCIDSDPELYKQSCTRLQKAIGLSAEDESYIAPHLAGVRDELLEMDSQIVLAGRGTDKDSISRHATLEGQQRNLLENKMATLKQKLSAEGQQLFDAYIEGMRKTIKFIPAAEGAK